MTSIATALPTTSGPRLLRLALTADAVVTGVNGLAYVTLAGPLADLLGLPAGTLRGLGAFLVAFAALVGVIAAARPAPARAAVLAIVAVNAAWAAGSLVAAVTAAGTPETAGTVWIVLQAVVVGAFAELQLLGLRRR